MLNKIKKLGLLWFVFGVATFGLIFLAPLPYAKAQIVNPAVGELGGVKKGTGDYTVDQKLVQDTSSGANLLKQFIRLWNNAITLGALMVIGYLVWGGIEWILSGGDSGKLDKARQKMMHAVVGLLILVSSFIILGFISSLFFGGNFDLLNLKFFSPSTGD